MSLRPSIKRGPAWLAVGLLVLTGCGESPEIRTYTVPKPAEDTSTPRVRLLAAILENKAEQWYFKLVGPITDVDRHGKTFGQFIESIRFTGKDDNPIEWKVPSGWEPGPKTQTRYATFFLGGKDKLPELTIFKFDIVSSTLDNINRWCELDLGRRPIRAFEVEKYARDVAAGPHPAVLVDMTGPGPRPRKHAPVAGLGKGRARPLPISYSTPTGWTETGPRIKDGITILTTFEIKEGTQSAEVQVTPLSGPTPPLLDNVIRWRGQMGLAAISQADLDRDPPRKVMVAGVNGHLVDLVGPSNRQLVAWVRQASTTWYFKMLGPKNVVDKHRDRFESFLQSVKFTGAADE
jgi:hypothetical protein